MEIFYVSPYVLVTLAPLVATTNRVLRRFVIGALMAIVAANLIFLVIPAIAPPRPFHATGLLGQMTRDELLAVFRSLIHDKMSSPRTNTDGARRGLAMPWFAAHAIMYFRLKSGEQQRYRVWENILLVEAADGYRAVFALPEIDPACTDRTILLVDRRDGQPLPAQEGPLRIVVPGEKRHSRWVRLVVALKIGRA